MLPSTLIIVSISEDNMERIRNIALAKKVVSPEAAAAMISKGMTVGCSGFTGSYRHSPCNHKPPE